MKEETNSFDLYLKASSSLLNISTIMLNENFRQNSWTRSSHILRQEESKDVKKCWAVPLKDKGNIVIIYDSSNPWALITVL